MMLFEKNRRDIVSFLNERYPNGVGCEVGVLRGEFSEHLLTNWNCKRLYLVDAWQEHTDYDETFHDHKSNFMIMQSNLKPFNSRVQICKGNSCNVVQTFDDEFFDFIYIDANHSYEGCKLDLDLYWNKLKKGGILMGDDYHLKEIETLSFNGNRVTFGVTKAVHDFVREHNKIFDISYTADWTYENGIPARNFVIQK